MSKEIDELLAFFEYRDLPPSLAKIARPFYDIATLMIEEGPSCLLAFGGDLGKNLPGREGVLLEARDCAFRSLLGSNNDLDLARWEPSGDVRAEVERYAAIIRKVGSLIRETANTWDADVQSLRGVRRKAAEGKRQALEDCQRALHAMHKKFLDWLEQFEQPARNRSK